MQLNILRNNILTATMEVGNDTIYKHELMGEHTIIANGYSSTPLNLLIGDYIEYKEEKFYINTPPQVQKVNANTFQYNITFEGTIYRLYNKLLIDEGAADFNYYGSPSLLLQLIIDNMNSIDAGWEMGIVEDAPEMNFAFQNVSCRQALTQIVSSDSGFDMEFYLNGKTINIVKKVGQTSTLSFQYGRGKGLYTLTRKPIENANLVTRVYGFGGTQNITLDYRGGIKNLIFEGAYLEKNTDIYGIIEGQYTDTTIFPKRTGTVSGVDSNNKLVIEDSSLEFNINDYLMSGVTAQIIFKTGALSGYTFDINTYDNANKKIYFNQFTDSNDYILPNSLNYAASGDTYTIVGIKMPQSYIDTAEADLQTATQEYLDQNCNPNVTYDLSVDEKHARINNIEINIGDEVGVVDDDLGLDDNIRCTAISYPIVNPYLISATIADSVTYTVQEKQIAQTIYNQKKIITVDRTRQEDTRLNTLLYAKLKDLIFDPDGYFQQADQSALTTETGLLTVGFKSQNFSIDNVVVENNYENDPNNFYIGAGTLFHNVYSITGLGNVWVMAANEVENLDPAKSYYVYARCSKTELSGQWMISEDEHTVEQETGFWNFNLGILFPVINDDRAFRFTNGMAYIFGDNVLAGMVRSIDGTQYVDLNHSAFYFGKEEQSIDYNVTTPNTLTINGALVTKMLFADDAIIQNLTVNSLVTTPPTDSDPNPQRIEIKEATNSLKFFAEGETNPIVTIDVQSGFNPSGGGAVSAGGGGLRATDYTYHDSEVTTKGIFSNASQQTFISATAGIDNAASVVGLLREKPTGNSLVNSLAAAVVGIDQTTETQYAPSYGGYFNSIFTNRLFFPVKQVIADYTLTTSDYFIACYNSSQITITLPTPPVNTGVGIAYKIKLVNNKSVLLNAGSNQLLMPNGSATTSADLNFFVNIESSDTDLGGSGTCAEVIWDGQYWLVSLTYGALHGQ